MREKTGVHYWWLRQREVGAVSGNLRTLAKRLRKAGATQAAKAVQRAIKSVDGAHRHAIGHWSRAQTDAAEAKKETQCV